MSETYLGGNPEAKPSLAQKSPTKESLQLVTFKFKSLIQKAMGLGVASTASETSAVKPSSEVPAATVPREEGQLSPETIAEFTRYVYQGGKLIKEGRYVEAIEYFQNNQALNRVGWRLSKGRSLLLNSLPAPEQYRALADTIAKNSWCKEDKTIQLAGLFMFELDQNNIPRQLNLQLPPPFLHDITLIYMEEWLHVLQEIRGKNLSQLADNESDVAAYLQRNGIPLTPAFLARYNREKDLRSLGNPATPI